jgi:Asp-tRNA(Asn)/Glu-tRNA(Gln) amidotransferase C subunit
MDPIKEEVTPETFDRLVELAALELAPDESSYLRREMNRQLEAIHQLAQIEVDPSTVLTSHGIPYGPEAMPALREDTWRAFPYADEIVGQWPETADRYAVVPEIPHETLE